MQTLKFLSDETVIAVNITIINDRLKENNETFLIYLMGGVGVEMSPHAQTEVIIIDDESKGMVSNMQNFIHQNLNFIRSCTVQITTCSPIMKITW